MTSSRVYSRGYRGQQDLQAMIGLIKKRPLDQIADYPGILDLQEMLAVPKIQSQTRLWMDPDGQLVSFTFLDGDDSSASLVFEIASSCKDRGLVEQIMAWVGTTIQQTRPADNGIFLLDTSSRISNPGRIMLLERLGFEPQTGGAVHLERSLSEPIAAPQLPPGFLIRPINGEMEAEDWVRLHRAALGTENMTTEYKLAMMRTPFYNPDMDLVTVTPKGVLAAYCVCFINGEENAITGLKVGHTDPIATHPDFQRRGLSKALILTGLALLKERGMDIAALSTGEENIAMIHTAESVGFHIKNKVIRYVKPLHFGQGEKR